MPNNKLKANLTSWKPGQSGNPGGKPTNGVRVSRLFSEIGNEIDPVTGEKKVVLIIRQIFESALNDKSSTAKMKAAEIVLDRMFGKPVETTVLLGENDTLSDEELEKMFSKEELQQYVQRVREVRNPEESLANGGVVL